MLPRSWLAKAKSVHDIGGEFVSDLGGKEPTDEQWERSERKWRDRTGRPSPVAPVDEPYFGCRMHDSGVLSIERSGSELRLRLDSINAKDFAHYLAYTLDLPPAEGVWPVDLVLRDVRYVRAAHADLRGGLRFVDWEHLGTPEFLYDWFFEQDGRLQWIAQLWRYDPKFDYARQTVYLMVDCARAAAEDRCPAVFAKSYGPPAAELYRDALARVDETPPDFDVWDDGRKTPEYILRRMAVRGFTRANFQPASLAPDRGPSARD